MFGPADGRRRRRIFAQAIGEPVQGITYVAQAISRDGVSVARSVKFRLAADKLAVREARLRVREFDLPEQTAANAELVVSELVANALLHAHLEPGDRIDLTLVRDGSRLMIEVDDHGSFSGQPRGRRGIGFRILDALCDDWHAQSGRVHASLRIAPARRGVPGAEDAAHARTPVAKRLTPRRWLPHA